MLLSPSDLLKRTWRMFKEHAWLYLGYAAWMLVPFAAFVIVAPLLEGWSLAIFAITFGAIELFIALWISIIMMRLTKNLETKREQEPPELHTQSLEVIPALLGVIILQTVIFLGGLVLLIIPGLIFSVWYGFASSAAALDERRGMQALAESKQLVQGRFFAVLWRLFWGPFLIGLIYSVIIGLIVALVAGIGGHDPLALVADATKPIWMEIIEMTGEILVLPIAMIYTTLLYLNLQTNPLVLDKEPTVS